MPPLSRTVGPVTVIALQDAEGRFPAPREEMLPVNCLLWTVPSG